MISAHPPRPSSRAWTELLHAEVAYLLRTAGIPVLHIKGPTVALWLYEEGERPWGDVDILVAPSRMDEAHLVLGEHGLVERNLGVNRHTVEDHAVTLARTDPAVGLDEVDLHDRFPGIDADPERAFSELWRRREPAQLACTEVWFPDYATRALLIALNTARTRSDRTLRDLDRLLAVDLDWVGVLELARRVAALPALRAGLELRPAGEALVRSTSLTEVSVSTEWRLRLNDAPRTALRLEELRRLPWSRRGSVVARWLFPPVAVLRWRDPRLAGGGAAVAVAYIRRLGDGIRSVPPSVRLLWRSRLR